MQIFEALGMCLPIHGCNVGHHCQFLLGHRLPVLLFYLCFFQDGKEVDIIFVFLMLQIFIEQLDCIQEAVGKPLTFVQILHCLAVILSLPLSFVSWICSSVFLLHWKCPIFDLNVLVIIQVFKADNFFRRKDVHLWLARPTFRNFIELKRFAILHTCSQISLEPDALFRACVRHSLFNHFIFATLSITVFDNRFFLLKPYFWLARLTLDQ